MRAKSLQSSLTLQPPWTVAHQAPLSIGFSRQDTKVDCHALLQGIFLTPGIEPKAFTSPALAPSGKPYRIIINSDWLSKIFESPTRHIYGQKLTNHIHGVFKNAIKLLTSSSPPGIWDAGVPNIWLTCETIRLSRSPRKILLTVLMNTFLQKALKMSMRMSN